MTVRSAILAGYEIDDISTQILSLTAIWYTNWFDSRLQWDPNNYSYIEEIILSHKKIWKPSLIVKNEIKTSGLIDNTEGRARVFFDGFVLWSLPITMNTMCEIDVQNYPFDTQSCTVQLSGWGYSTGVLSTSIAKGKSYPFSSSRLRFMVSVSQLSVNDNISMHAGTFGSVFILQKEVELLPQMPMPVNRKLYARHGEWSFVSSSVYLHNDTDDINTFRTLMFTLKFRRRWQFYSQYLLLPIMLNSILMISAFLLPIDSGERLTFSLTVLLAYVVLLTIVTNNLPPISTRTSVLHIYLSSLMVLGTVVTLFSIGLLSLYNTEESDRISFALHTFTKYFIAPVATFSPCRTKDRSQEHPPSDVTVRGNLNVQNVMIQTGGSSSRPVSRHSGFIEVKTLSFREFAVVLNSFLFRMSVLGLCILTSSTLIFFYVHS
ncbi:acetylcholine receptor non-alpha chain-like [Gigantopelta aegis]|uniref:acetylcholine receptor non-alpha chain-like n=1 Tax=Gigantopelta aegis TaxID=1735272 RepID=UPI001B8893F8|nr:acetylcholine receptor non-alpha chain-like [Gigantopelta aegis]